MRKGTFSVKKAGSNSAAHNSRENAPKYLIGLESNSENYYELIQSDKDFILEAQQIYKDKIGQSMQKKQIPNLVQETVLTLQKNQDENSVKDLFQKLKNKYGGHELLEVSVHRDEGHFEKDGIAYYPTKNILKKDEAWYIQSDPNSKEFDIKVDINDFKKVFNYHAHAKFSMFDKELGKSARMQKKDMSERIKFVSQELGLVFSPDKKTSRIQKPVHQVKDEHHAKAQQQQKQQYNYRDYQKQIIALNTENKELKRELHNLNSQVKNGKADIQQLELKLQTVSNAVKDKVVLSPEEKKLEAYVHDLKRYASYIKEPEIKRSMLEEMKELAERKGDRYGHELSYIENKYEEYFIEQVYDIDEIKSTQKSYIRAFKEILPSAKNEKEVVEYVKTLKNELESSKKALEVSEASKSDLRAPEQDMSYLKTKNKELYNANRALYNKNTSLEHKNKTLTSTVAELESKVSYLSSMHSKNSSLTKPKSEATLSDELEKMNKEIETRLKLDKARENFEKIQAMKNKQIDYPSITKEDLQKAEKPKSNNRDLSR